MSLLSVSGEASRESENRKRSSAKNILEKIFFAQLWVLQASPIAMNAKANLKFAFAIPPAWGVCGMGSSMLHIFVDPSQTQGDVLEIIGTDCNHIRNVLRMKPGEELAVSNGVDQKEYRYGIEEFTEDSVICRLRFVKDADVELPVKIYLFQGLPKADKMEWITQKCVELGVYQIIPVETERSVVRLDESKKKKKIQRWQTIAEAAAKQSRRGMIPAVQMPMSMKESVAYAKEQTQAQLIPYELQENDGSTRNIFKEAAKPGTAVAVFIGPEGGFTPEEVALAKEAGVKPISLGKRILRTETAGMTVLSWVIYETEIE